jgi:ABC-type multidrug transport system permease subunit
MSVTLLVLSGLKDSLWVAEKEFRLFLGRLPALRIGLTIVVPVIVLIIFSLRTGSLVSQQALPVAVVDLDHSQSSQTLLKSLSASGQLVVLNFQNRTIAENSMKNGNAYAVVVIPQGYANNIELHRQTSVDLLLDDSNPFFAREIYDAFNSAISQAANNISPQPIVFSSSFEYGTGFGLVGYVVPGMVAMTAMFASSFQSMSVVFERAFGQFDRIRATPASSSSVILGYVIAGSTIGMIQAMAIVAFSHFVFQALVLNVGAVVVVVLLTAFTFTGFGFALAGVARDPREATMIFQLVNGGMVLLSGVFFPIEVLPTVFRIVGSILPLAFAVNILRAAMIKGLALTNPQILTSLGVLLVYAAGALGIGSRLLYRILSQ